MELILKVLTKRGFAFDTLKLSLDSYYW